MAAEPNFLGNWVPKIFRWVWRRSWGTYVVHAIA
jgi:hypothetical protein